MNSDAARVTFGRHIGFTLASTVWVSSLHLVALPVLTKSLGPVLYGSWSLLAATVSLAAPFAMLGFGMALVRFLAARQDESTIRDDYWSACATILITGTAFSIALYFLSGFLATAIFRNPAAVDYLRLGSALILFTALNTLPLAFFRMRRRLGIHALITGLHQTLVTGAMIAAIGMGYGLKGVIIASVAAQALSCVLSMLLVVRNVGIAVPTMRSIPSYLRWGVPLTPNTAILWIINSSDRYMVTYFLGIAATGVYGAAYAFGNYASFVLTPVQTVLYPNLLKSYAEGHHAEASEYLERSIKYVMMLAIPSAVGLSVLGEPLLQTLTTSEFTSGSRVIPLVSAGMVLFCFYQLTVGILHVTDHTHMNVRILSIAAALNITVNVVLIPRFGIMGAATATLIAYGVLGLLTTLLTRQYLRFSLRPAFIGKSLASAAVMGLCVNAIAPASIPGILLSVGAGIAIYFAMLLLLNGVSRSEVAFFLSLMRGMVPRSRRPDA